MKLILVYFSRNENVNLFHMTFLYLLIWSCGFPFFDLLAWFEMIVFESWITFAYLGQISLDCCMWFLLSIVGFELIMFWVIIFLEYLGLVLALGKCCPIQWDFLSVSTFWEEKWCTIGVISSWKVWENSLASGASSLGSSMNIDIGLHILSLLSEVWADCVFI